MVIDLRKCVDEPCHIERALDVASLFASYDELESLPEVAVVLDISAAGAAQFLVRGRIEGGVRAFCVRCLEPFATRLVRSFQLIYRPRPSDGSAAGSDDVDDAYYDGMQLRVLDLVEEQVNLAFPMRFICLDECRGLCTQCGANRNVADCACAVDADRSRSTGFESLASLKRRPV